MTLRLCALAVALLLGSVPTSAVEALQVVDTPQGARAFTELGAFYANNATKPSYEQALRDLADADAGKRADAGAFLLALFRQSYSDESNGRAPVKRSPFWGGAGSNSDARIMRKEIAAAFGHDAHTSEALSCVTWLLNEEKLADNQDQGMVALRAIASPEATALLKSLLVQPHPDQAVATAAIQMVGDRHLTELSPDVKRLCAHYRKAVREAALATMKKLQGPVIVPDFDPAGSFTPWLSHQLDLIARLVAYPIPLGAYWSHIAKAKNQAGDATVMFDGWYIAASAGHAAYAVDTFGRRIELADKGITVKPCRLADTAKDYLDIRRKGGEGLAVLSRSGGLTWQFEPKLISLPEALVGAWCYVRGDKVSAAMLLLPLIDGMRDDRWMEWIAADVIGPEYLDAMLHSFTYDRDYAAAIAMARHLSSEPFAQYVWHDRAAAFADQLTRRKDDFVTLQLPTAEKWASDQKSMTRKERIQFLAQHLRLLNAFQMGQPGGVAFGEAQSAEPRSAGGMTAVINPGNELNALKLQPADLPTLVPFLADDDYLVAYGYWRDFHPQRYLYTVGWMIANIMDDVAKTHLSKYDVFLGLDAAAKQRHLDEILAWCAKNAGKTRDQLPDELHRPPPGGPRIDAP